MFNSLLFHQKFMPNSIEEAGLQEKETLEILIPGCGGFPSGEEFLSMLLRSFPKAKKFEIWLFEPDLFEEDRVRINALTSVFEGTDKKIILHLEPIGIKAFYHQHPEVGGTETFVRFAATC